MTTFEEFLKELHVEHYIGTDDNMPEAFENWLSDLSIDEWLVHGNGFGIFIINECTKVVTNV